MGSDKLLGQHAYEAFCDSPHYAAAVAQGILKPWDQLLDEEKHAWQLAARAAVREDSLRRKEVDDLFKNP